MKNLLYSIILLILFSSCGKKKVVDAPIFILFDHPLKSDALQSDQILATILSPFESKTREDSLFCPHFKLVRIDAKVPIMDSLTKNEGWIVRSQNWMLGGSKNAEMYKKNLENSIQKMKIIPEFDEVGDTSYVNKYFDNNKLKFIFLIGHTSLKY